MKIIFKTKKKTLQIYYSPTTRPRKVVFFCHLTLVLSKINVFDRDDYIGTAFSLQTFIEQTRTLYL